LQARNRKFGESRESSKQPFCSRVYDDVVDAVATLRGTKDADEIVKMLEDQQGQDAETALVKKILAGLKKKP
jgi:hypothetical protein